MRVVGDAAGEWFHVAVVVRGGDSGSGDSLADAVRAQLADEADVPPGVGEPEPTCSFDGPPPEGEAGVGLWVRRPTIGAAVDAAVGVVVSTAGHVAGRPVEVWDARVVPLTAVLRNPAEGSVATLEATLDADPLDT